MRYIGIYINGFFSAIPVFIVLELFLWYLGNQENVTIIGFEFYKVYILSYIYCIIYDNIKYAFRVFRGVEEL